MQRGKENRKRKAKRELKERRKGISMEKIWLEKDLKRDTV
jgi:hypothetical protein